MLHHDFDKLLKRSLPWIPSQERLGLGGVAEQLFYLGGAEEARVNLHKHLTRCSVDALLIHAFAFPTQVDADMMESQRAELTHGVVFARGDDKILWLLLLQDEPHALHIVLGIAPVAEGVEVAEIQLVLITLFDASSGQRDLACDEGLASTFALVVEEDAVDGEHAIALAVVFHNPEAVLLGYAIGRAGIEGRRLLLWHLLHLAEQLRGGGLVDLAFLLQAKDTHGLKEAQRAYRVGFGSVFWAVERHLDMALCSQVIDLVGLHFLDDDESVMSP